MASKLTCLDAVTDIVGDHGVFHVKPNGEFTYTLTEDLAAGQNVTETVQYYKISDGEGHTDAGVLTLNITGTDAHLA
ncbi:VCBS repeat-containing protein [Rhizobium leguminosarum]|nr:VCBS repeat-containing protein [Rhizobium leguminosarum]